MRAVSMAGCLVLLAATIAGAQPVWVSVGGGYAAPGKPFDTSTTVSEYLEPGLVDSTYTPAAGMLADVAARVGVGRRWAIGGGVGLARRDADIAMRGRIPHPFFFGQGRATEHALTAPGRRDTAVRGEVAWSAGIGRIDVTLSGGPVLAHVRQDLVQAVVIRETGYPYDEVALGTPSMAAESGWGVGGTAALDVTWRASERLGLGLTARASRARVTLAGASVDTTGPTVSAGLRYRLR